MCWLSEVLISASFHVSCLLKQETEEKLRGSKQNMETFVPQKEGWSLR